MTCAVQKDKKLTCFCHPLEVRFFNVQELLATALYCELMLRQLPMMTSESLSELLISKTEICTTGTLGSLLVLYLTIQNVLILLCDHLPSDSGLPLRVTALLSIVFDSTRYHVSKIFVAFARIKIGDKKKNLFVKTLFLTIFSV